MDAKPKRRWYQFSLRTMFVLTLVVSIPLAWAGYSLNWIRQRHEVLTTGAVYSASRDYDGIFVSAPLSLRLFGETGMRNVFLDKTCQIAAEDIRRLFPEADVLEYGEWNILPKERTR